MSAKELYAKCAVCNGTTKTVQPIATGRVFPPGFCSTCLNRGQVREDDSKDTAYVPCPSCSVITSSAHIPEVLPIGSKCPACRSGFDKIGLTERQLEAIVEERDRLLDYAFRMVYGKLGAEVKPLAEAVALVEGKEGRAEEYRIRKNLPPITRPPTSRPELYAPSSDEQSSG